MQNNFAQKKAKSPVFKPKNRSFRTNTELFKMVEVTRFELVDFSPKMAYICGYAFFVARMWHEFDYLHILKVFLTGAKL